MVGENVYSVPCFMDILAFWVDEEKMANAELESIKTKEDFEKYVKANSGNGKYGYGDAWEKTYVFNYKFPNSLYYRGVVSHYNSIDKLRYPSYVLWYSLNNRF